MGINYLSTGAGFQPSTVGVFRSLEITWLLVCIQGIWSSCPGPTVERRWWCSWWSCAKPGDLVRPTERDEFMGLLGSRNVSMHWSRICFLDIYSCSWCTFFVWLPAWCFARSYVPCGNCAVHESLCCWRNSREALNGDFTKLYAVASTAIGGWMTKSKFHWQHETPISTTCISIFWLTCLYFVQKALVLTSFSTP